MSKTITINGIDFTNAFTPTGYTVAYSKRRGNNGGVMLDGSKTEDVRAIKAVVTCYCMPQTEDQLQQLLTVIANTYVTVYYFDPKEKAYRTMTAIPSDPAQKFKGKGADAMDYWTGTVITLEEK